MTQKRILVPTQSVDDWKNLLAEPDKHWKSGYSAMSMAQNWESASGLPWEITSIFNIAKDDYFKDIELALAIPEYKVDLDGGKRPSQNDVFALLSSENGLTAITVEGKAREAFEPTLDQWRKKVSEGGYRLRFDHIKSKIGLNDTIPGHIRYQLLHRTASAVIEAERFHCGAAVMIVQSFVGSDSENHYDDYAQFIHLYDVIPEKDNLVFLKAINGIKLYSAWVHSFLP